MKQIAQNYKSGELTVLDVPAPACRPGGVLVRSLFSLISTGTEMMKVTEAKLSMVGKARARPDQVRKVLDTVAQQGAVATYKKVMNRLDSYTPLGYSLCGVVIEVGRGAEEFHVGQLVAAAGNEYALHAEYNWVPVNMCVPVPRGVSPEHAAFSTVGAIAMHGVRRAEVQLGETACVIGLGLVGQLVVRLLVAAGVRVVGLDVIEDRCQRAEKAGAVLCAAPTDEGMAAVQQALAELTGGRGADHVFLAAGRVVERAGRDRGEAGPGPRPRRRHRQDPAGPAVERLLRQGARRPLLPVLRSRAVRRPLRAGGHRLPGGLRPLDRAAQPRVLPRPLAHKEIEVETAGHRGLPGGAGDHRLRRPGLRRRAAVGVLLEYPAPAGGQPAALHRAGWSRPAGKPRHAAPATGQLAVGFIGAGNYASSMLLPHLARIGDRPAWRTSRPPGRCRRSTPSAASASPPPRPDADAVLGDESLDAIFIVTRHHTHADLVCRALETGKAVFVEKPLALTRDELDRIVDVVEKTGNDRLMVGFNRRFAPLLVQLKSRFGQPGGSSVTRYLVNAGRLEADSWYRNEELEGSRFTGEGGHFIDTLSWWADSLPEEVYAVPRPRARRRAGHRAVPERLDRHHHLRHGRQPPLSEGDARRRGRRPERTARQLPDGHRVDRTAPQHHAVARRPGQGPAARARALRRGHPDRRADAHLARVPGGHHQRHHRGGGEPGERPSGAGVSALSHRRGSAGTRAGPPGCRRPRWPGAPATRRSARPGRAGR